MRSEVKMRETMLLPSFIPSESIVAMISSVVSSPIQLRRSVRDVYICIPMNPKKVVLFLIL